ncbi:MAG: glycerol-3-phosphate 1-O-acyltransferase PlsY [Bacteroidetes bacterium]|nr:glycerol-3-phosphate 1-O-acyltransferase PlsY [Bacteroidota bacterium]MDA1118920.1 glycerol-3-phosphate 1-O-acyltransferase PlsY [Bacteroidota bacterium]
MHIIVIIFFSSIAYLLGSFPTSVWFGKYYFKIDILKHGSGNPGATNTFRVLGRRAGTIVLLGDILKGAIATTLAVFLLRLDFIYPDELLRFRLLFGVFAVVGHIFSVFLNFKGGKGVATLLGVTLAIAPEGAAISIAIFVTVLMISKYVSVGSIVAALAFPLTLILLPALRPDDPILIVYGFLLTIVIIWTHRMNIRRLIKGEENKTNLMSMGNKGE